jgi:hypothetical protein
MRIDPPIRLPADEAKADSELRWATVAGRRLFLLRQKGAFADICYDHGRLLAPQIHDGVLPEIIATIRRATAPSGNDGCNVAGFAYRTISDTIWREISAEFRSGVDAVATGYRDALGRRDAFDRAAIRDANVAIEAGNVATGLLRRLEKWGASENGELAPFLLSVLRRALSDRGVASVRDPGVEAIIADAATDREIRRVARMGCTGFFVPPQDTADGASLHARTFDGAFYRWSRTPGLMLIDETAHAPAGERWRKYVALGTAGLIYSGGISGLNEAGIGISLHQLSTVNYDWNGSRGRKDLTPFVVQRILREARSLDDAAEIAEDSGHFGAWTILVSDAKGGGLRIEVCAGMRDPVRVTRLSDREPQTNHFRNRGFMETGAKGFFSDAHFTPTYNKWLESHSRYRRMSNKLGASPTPRFDTDWAIEALADHGDNLIGGASRSFGRTISRAYTQMVTIVRADGARRSGADTVWITTGDRKPAPHAVYAGFAIDWNALSATPAPDRPMRRDASHDAAFMRGLEHYANAVEAFDMPKASSGAYLERRLSIRDEATRAAVTLAHLEKAAAAMAGAHPDFAVYYMTGRLEHWHGEWLSAGRDQAAATRAYAAALRSFERLRAVAGRGAGPRDPFEIAPGSGRSRWAGQQAKNRHSCSARALRVMRR